MQYRLDQKSGNKLSIMGFGCMRLPGGMGRVDQKKAEELILRAVEKGINYFDTAYLYSGSEAALGTAIAYHSLREKVFIATKLPIGQCSTYADFDRLFEIQLRQLQTDYIDYYLMHAVTGPDQWKKLCGIGIEKWIEEKKKSGKIRNLGFSYHGTRDDFLTLLELYDWDFCQIQYNYFNVNYQAGVTGLRKAAEKGLPVIIMEPLLGGRLASGLPEKAAKAFGDADAVRTPAAWAFDWLWNQPEVTVVLSGMGELPQLEENIKTAENAEPGMLTEAEQKVIGQVVGIFNESYKVPCTGCNYCMPCPKGIDIPGCFAAYNSSFAFGRTTGIMQYVMATGASTKLHHYASECVACGKCEKHCPQNIPIPQSLKTVSGRMEPFWFRPAMAVARKVMNKGE